MKKLLLVLLVAAGVSIVASSCGGQRKGVGCPTANSNKPFRA
jgi:hypothetical protein